MDELWLTQPSTRCPRLTSWCLTRSSSIAGPRPISATSICFWMANTSRAFKATVNANKIKTCRMSVTTSGDFRSHRVDADRIDGLCCCSGRIHDPSVRPGNHGHTDLSPLAEFPTHRGPSRRGTEDLHLARQPQHFMGELRRPQSTRAAAWRQVCQLFSEASNSLLTSFSLQPARDDVDLSGAEYLRSRSDFRLVRLARRVSALERQKATEVLG